MKKIVAIIAIVVTFAVGYTTVKSVKAGFDANRAQVERQMAELR